MKTENEAKKARLAQLQEALKDLKETLPEHCAGRTEFISVHHASLAHWQKIEDLEEEIKALKTEESAIKGLAHICLSAKDLSAVEIFYCSCLGLKKVFDFIRNNRVIGFYLEVSPGNYVEVFQQNEIDVHAKGPILHFCLEVDDIDQIGIKLTAGGYEATPKTLGADNSWQIWTTDPSGVKIEFHQYTARSSQITHANCIMD